MKSEKNERNIQRGTEIKEEREKRSVATEIPYFTHGTDSNRA